MHASIRTLTLSLIVLLTGCPDTKNETMSDSDASTDAGDTTAGDTTADTAPTSTGDSAGDTGNDTPATATSNPPGDTTAEPGDTSDTADSATDSGGNTDGDTDTDGPVELLPQCVDLCEHGAMCGLTQPDDGCAQGCSEAFGGVDGECKAASDAYLECLVALDCAALEAAMGGDPGECAAALEAQQAACAGNNPVCAVGGGGGPGACEFAIECEGDPKLEMMCDDATCSCLQDGEKVGECAADMVCDTAEDLDVLQTKMQDCCGF